MSRGAIFSRSVKYNLELGTQSFKGRENNNHYLVRCVPTRHRHQARHRPTQLLLLCQTYTEPLLGQRGRWQGRLGQPSWL